VARSDGGVENDINQFISDISLSFCRVLWHYGELQNSIGIKGYFSILSPCVSVREYRGSGRGGGEGVGKMAYSIFVVLLPLSLRATLPIFYMAKRRGRRAGFSLYGCAKGQFP
jgi:hypothetical protein